MMRENSAVPLDGVARRFQIIRRIALAWILLVIVGSLQPNRPGRVQAIHRELHWAIFAVAASLLLLLARTRLQAIRRAVSALLLGVALEYLQHWIYHKATEWRDVGDDALAILAALAVYWLALKLNRIRRAVPALQPSMRATPGE